ncbi:MAG: hypothetical protein AB7D57_04935 [Desulfovibrionaceae bacterium]
MSTSAACGACRTGHLKFWHFWTAVVMVAYGVGVLFLPAGYPACLPGLEGRTLLVPLFDVAFAAVNILLAWGVAVGMRRALAARQGEAAVQMEKIRNGLVAGFGFAAAFRVVALFAWLSQL